LIKASDGVVNLLRYYKLIVKADNIIRSCRYTTQLSLHYTAVATLHSCRYTTQLSLYYTAVATLRSCHIKETARLWFKDIYLLLHR